MLEALLLRAKQDRGDMILVTCCGKEMNLFGECLQGDILYSSIPIKLSNTAYSSLKNVFTNKKIKLQDIKIDNLEWNRNTFNMPSHYITKQAEWKNKINSIINEEQK
jgi:hypothetical protein